MQENLCKISSYTGENLLPDDSNQGIQLLFDGVSAQRNPEGTVDHIGIYLHGIQHVTPVALGAGTACTDTDIVILQNVDGVLGGYTGDADIQHMWGGVRAVQLDAGQGRQLFCQVAKQFVFFFDVIPKRCTACGAGSGKAENGRCSFSTAAEITLLSAAMDEGGEGFQSGRDV